MKIKFNILLTALASVVILTSVTWYLSFETIRLSPDSAKKIKKEFSKETIAYFSEIAFGAEYSKFRPLLSRWTQKEIPLVILGNATESDHLFIKSVVDSLNDLIKTSRINVTRDKTYLDYGIQINFRSMEELIEAYPNEEFVFKSAGFIKYEKNLLNELTHCSITINSGMKKINRRHHVILEEITQSLGLFVDSDLYDNSIFFDNYSAVTKLAKIDKELIKLLYNYEIPVGIERTTFLRDIRNASESD